jgi:hypothetical protein
MPTVKIDSLEDVVLSSAALFMLPRVQISAPAGGPVCFDSFEECRGNVILDRAELA